MVENAGFTKIANANTYDAFNTDSNGAQVNYRVVQQARPFESTPQIEGRTNASEPRVDRRPRSPRR